MSESEFPYLHGFSEIEQDRLKAQAKFAEHTIYQNVNFSSQKNIIEVGCGVGAQTEILLRRFPDLKITCVDLNEQQLLAAEKNLNSHAWAKGRFDLKKMSGDDLKFSAQSFDGAFVCWLLEHVPDPAKILSEIRRVLCPGAEIIITEVMNSSFFLDPYSPNVWKYWMAFNDFQYDKAGDPFIGAKLGNLLSSVGYRDVKTEVKSWHFDNRKPDLRKKSIEYWSDLLFSASDLLVNENFVTNQIVQEAKKEMRKVANDPNAVFFYSFMQASAKAYW